MSPACLPMLIFSDPCRGSWLPAFHWYLINIIRGSFSETPIENRGFRYLISIVISSIFHRHLSIGISSVSLQYRYLIGISAISVTLRYLISIGISSVINPYRIGMSTVSISHRYLISTSSASQRYRYLNIDPPRCIMARRLGA